MGWFKPNHIHMFSTGQQQSLYLFNRFVPETYAPNSDYKDKHWLRFLMT